MIELSIFPLSDKINDKILLDRTGFVSILHESGGINEIEKGTILLCEKCLSRVLIKDYFLKALRKCKNYSLKLAQNSQNLSQRVQEYDKLINRISSWNDDLIVIDDDLYNIRHIIYYAFEVVFMRSTVTYCVIENFDYDLGILDLSVIHLPNFKFLGYPFRIKVNDLDIELTKEMINDKVKYLIFWTLAHKQDKYGRRLVSIHKFRKVLSSLEDNQKDIVLKFVKEHNKELYKELIKSVTTR